MHYGLQNDLIFRKLGNQENLKIASEYILVSSLPLKIEFLYLVHKNLAKVHIKVFFCLTLLVFIIFPKYILHKIVTSVTVLIKNYYFLATEIYFSRVFVPLCIKFVRNISGRITVSKNFVFLMKYSPNLKFCLYTLIETSI